MDAPPGRREANRQATTDAIREAARRHFESEGFEAASVREIAADAGVSERTFYRYFDGKEGLLADDVQRLLNDLRAAIVDRPAREAPLVAIEAAIRSLGEPLVPASGARTLWLFAGRPRPFEILQRSAPRPLLRFEAAIAEAVVARSQAAGAPLPELESGLVARVAVATIRTAAIHHVEVYAADPDAAPPIVDTIAEAFALLRASTRVRTATKAAARTATAPTTMATSRPDV